MDTLLHQPGPGRGTNAKPADDATLAAPPLALDETIASTPDLAAAISSSPAHSSASMRATVLPRIEVVDAQPRLVVDGKRRFEPLQKLGEGGHGEVTGVRDHDIGRNVAIKRLRPSAKSPGIALRFAEEVRTVGQLEHPNIVPIHDVGLDENGDYYFVMKYVDGETLESVIEKLAAGDPTYHAKYGFERRVQIFQSILEAVAFAHAKGIVHRDIKPANVMIGAYGEVVVMDWGIAKRHRDAATAADNALATAEVTRASTGRRGTLFETRVGELVGTPAYMSPEQARGAKVDERSDVYSLSLLFHELLCLSHPLADKTTFDEMLHGVQHEPVPHTGLVSSPYQAPAPQELGWFVKKGLAKDPAERYQSVNEMLDRLARRAEGSFPIQCPITFMKRVLGGLRRFVDHHPFVAMALLSTSALAFVASVVIGTVRALH